MNMKQNFKALVLGFALMTAAGLPAYAMSEFVSMSVKPLWPTTTTPGAVLLYEVTVERQGQGFLEVVISSDGLPEGASAVFTQNPVRYTGHQTTIHSFLMTVTCTSVMPIETWPFTVTGSARRESITITNQISARLLEPNVAPLIAALELPKPGVPVLRGLGASGQTYQIEATSDLGNAFWAPIGSTTADGNGRFTHFDNQPSGASSTMRFYRAVALASNPAPSSQE